jgi:hypothetical protein
MNNLTDEARGIMRVLGRSPKDTDGWAKVSSIVWPLLEPVPAELMEREGDATNGGRARFTEKGQTIHDYTL